MNRAPNLRMLRSNRGLSEADAPTWPSADVYDQECMRWPWGQLLVGAADWVVREAPLGAHIFDYMCGTGYLLELISHRRPDLRLSGCDLHTPFVEHARRVRPMIKMTEADARVFVPEALPDVVICTAGLHHLRSDEHVAALRHMRQHASASARFLIGEEVIGPHHDESSRRLAAFELGSSLVEYGTRAGWDEALIRAALDVLRQDVFQHGEYKRSSSGWLELITGELFPIETKWFWQPKPNVGDVLYVCSGRGD